MHGGASPPSPVAGRKTSTAKDRSGSILVPQANAPAPEHESVVERILKGTDPNFMTVPVYFDYKKEARCYKFFPTVGSSAIHFSLDGSSIRKDDPEAIQQEDERIRRKKEVELAAQAELNPDLIDEGVSTKILKNQFNYNERGSQTMNQPLRERCVLTDPPPLTSFSAQATAWDIYDAYEEERIQNEKAAAAQKRAAAAHRAGKEEEKTAITTANTALLSSGNDSKTPSEILSSTSLGIALKMMERMVNQNDCYDIIDDFKYWEDQSDRFKEDGTLLPLWQFITEKSKKKSVTSIALNCRYTDFFAVGYGSYDFQKNGKGLVQCFTLKNAVPSTPTGQLNAAPEFSFTTECGVMCLAFHPVETALLACGLYDGTVCVYDFRVKDGKKMRPLYISTVRTGKHTDPVWEIYWLPSVMEYQFRSISTDGRITSWILNKKELLFKDVMTLNTGVRASDPESAVLNRLGGTCMDYSARHDSVVVGTHEGHVLLCTAGYNGVCLERYAGHSMPVYTTRWNPFHADLFLTCSADWTVKLWLRHSRSPLLTFDLGDAVGDVCWAPFSSTVFAAVTASGRVAVFDLRVNKTEPLCAQTVVKGAKLTRIHFSPTDPIVVVGDSKGTILTFKLSPNLRRMTSQQIPPQGKGAAAAVPSISEEEKLRNLVEATLKDRTLLAQE